MSLKNTFLNLKTNIKKLRFEEIHFKSALKNYDGNSIVFIYIDRIRNLDLLDVTDYGTKTENDVDFILL